MEKHGFTGGNARLGGGALPGSSKREFGQNTAQSTACTLTLKWSTLHQAAETVALIAGLSGGEMPAEVRNFPIVMREATPAMRVRAEQGITDIIAILEPGLAALLAVHSRGADTRPAANALWQEFIRARDQVMALASVNTGQPKRFSV